MKFSKATLAAAVGIAISLGVSSQATASVYAGSRLLIQNLEITSSNTGTPPGSDIGSFTFTLANTATLNGVSDTSAGLSNSCGGSFGVPPGPNTCGADPALDAAAANAPGSAPVRGNNDFTFFGTSLNQYSNSDSIIYDAELTGDATTRTAQIAEAELQTGVDALANSEITSSTNLIFRFSVGGPQTTDLTINFEADPNLAVAIDQLNFLNGNVQANIAFSLTLSDSAGNTVSWSPQGDIANSCTADFATCNELADSEDLNRNPSSGVNPIGISYSDDRFAGPNPDQGFTAFGVEILGIEAGDYTLALSGLTSVSVRQTQAVPVPGTLLLLGAGLVAVGARRKAMGPLS